MPTPNENDRPNLELDPSLYSLQGDELTFIQKHTGISDEDGLKNHVIEAQSKAYEIYPYPCIRSFGFLQLRMARNVCYKSALKLRQERQNPILLDIGCCFGSDVRKAVDDGWPVEDIVASDLRKEFWDAGHQLFGSTLESFPVVFVPGDAFDPAFLAPSSPEDLTSQALQLATTGPTNDRPNLKELTSLNPLRGKISAIHASAFFHLFDEHGQLDLAWRLAALLAPKPGSIIFGQQAAHPVAGTKVHTRTGKRRENYCHSPTSWEKLWVETILGPAGIKATVTSNLTIIDEEREVWLMRWSVVLI